MGSVSTWQAAPARHGKRMFALLGISLAGFVLCLTRATHPSQRFSFWGEDGIIFLTQVRAHGVLQSYTTTYAGYFHLLPRTFAAVISIFPIQWAPPMFACAAMGLSSFVAGVSYLAAREGLALPMWAALVVSGTVLLLPASGFETFATLTNMEWYCAAGLAVFLAAWWEGWETHAIPTSILIFAACATTPLSVVFLPLVILRTWFRRSRLDVTVASSFFAGICYQGVGHLLAPSSPGVSGISIRTLTSLYSVRAVDEGLVGDRLIYDLWHAITPVGATVLGLALLSGLVTWALLQREARKRGTVMVLVLLSAFLYALPAVVRGLSSLAGAGFAPDNGSIVALGGRYFGTPSLCLVLALLILLRPPSATNQLPARPRRLHTAPLAVVCALLAIMLAVNVPLDLRRQRLSIWEHSVSRADAVCRASKGLGRVNVTNAPGGQWQTRLTCHQAFG